MLKAEASKFQAQSTHSPTQNADDGLVCDVAMGVGLHTRTNASPCQGNEHLLLRFICAINTLDVLYTKHPRFPAHDPLSGTLGRNAMVHTALQKPGLTTGFSLNCKRQKRKNKHRTEKTRRSSNNKNDERHSLLQMTD
jgi:hypothetical protein